MISIKELRAITELATFREAVREAFFKAMVAEYSRRPKKGTYYASFDKEAPWEVVHAYFATPLNSKVGEVVVISYEDVPVWMMQYFGQCEKEAIPCLRAALLETYSTGAFVAGRGPHYFERHGFVYQNFVEESTVFTSGFGNFRGTEEIHNPDGRMVGKSRFHGGMMV